YWFRLSDGVRQGLWILAGLGTAAYVGWRIVYPLIQQINPYYTARMIEKATPGSRNGIINWLDLRNQDVSPIVRDALSRRAVHELDSANMEEAIPTRNPVRTGIIVGVILLALILIAIFLPDQIGSLFQRALFPFKSTIIPTHTRLEVIPTGHRRAGTRSGGGYLAHQGTPGGTGPASRVSGHHARRDTAGSGYGIAGGWRCTPHHQTHAAG
ncbi:MAG TPA: hypothetical protein PKD72_08595, partial [Gemmatales bacterium]|nr:hypothetical protein [Gemmatales bacterium]